MTQKPHLATLGKASTDTSVRVPVVQWPRTPPFHGGNTGSNPVGDAIQESSMQGDALFVFPPERTLFHESTPFRVSSMKPFLEAEAAGTEPSLSKRHFRSSSGEIFHGYFSEGRTWSFKKHDLLDARARRLFETAALACSLDAYPFQAPLTNKTGPCVLTDGHEMLMLSSYDYLGLIGDPRIDAAAIEAVKRYGTGTGGVRLLTGTLELHRETEEELAAFKGTEGALTFTSGYVANLAVISSLFGPADRVIADSLSHRSLMDACRLAGVQVQRFQHNDPDSLRHEIKTGPQANRTLIISDGVFSMDGDVCCLP